MKKQKINGYEITRIETLNYSNNGNLALELMCSGEYGEEPFATLTLNLGEKLSHNLAYVDTNNCTWAKKFIEETEIGVYAHQMRVSGFCEYPLYQFDLEKIKKYNEI